MKWLFLMFLLDTSAGEVRPKMRVNAVFNSEADCNRLGRELASGLGFEDNSLKSFSICVPDSVFLEKGLQSERLDQ